VEIQLSVAPRVIPSFLGDGAIFQAATSFAGRHRCPIEECNRL